MTTSQLAAKPEFVEDRLTGNLTIVLPGELADRHENLRTYLENCLPGPVLESCLCIMSRVIDVGRVLLIRFKNAPDWTLIESIRATVNRFFNPTPA